MGTALAWDDGYCEVTIVLGWRGTHLVKRIRGGSAGRRKVRVGAPDGTLTGSAGLAAVTELCDRLGVAGAIDAATGPVKVRDRGSAPAGC